MDSSTQVCLVCGMPTPSSKRRTLSPPLNVNKEARGFLFMFITNDRDFDCDDRSSPRYACKSCFAQLEKGSRLCNNMISLISNLRATARASGNIAVAMFEPFPSPATPVSGGTQTDLPQTALKRLRECEDTEPAPRRLRLTEQPENGAPAVTVNAVQESASEIPQKRSLECQDAESTPKRCRLIPSEITPEPSTPASVMKVTHVRRGRTIKSYTLRESPYKRIAKTLRYKQAAYTARTCLSVPAAKLEAVKKVVMTVKMECRHLCQLKPNPSVLRIKSDDELKSFSWKAVTCELKQRAPTFLAILQAAAESSRQRTPQQPSCKRRKKRSKLVRRARESVIGMAAAVLLKERNQHMCKPQTVISALLYAGHAAKKVYNRLNKLGISVCHQVTLRTIRRLGNNHDVQVRTWKNAAPSQPNYIIVGDNIDKNVTPRDMRVGNQVKSLHYFHSYAVQDRVDLGNLSGDGHVRDINNLPVSAILPTVNDCVNIRNNYIILAARVIVENLSHFTFLQNCVVKHITHKFSKETAKKSVIVPLGVIPKNENKNEEMVEIIELLQQYVPTDEVLKQVRPVAFGGDQLTVERCRGSQSARVTSDNQIEALEGLHPFASDWHAEVVLLQVFFERLYHGGSNLDGGSLLQLRNLLNRRNVAKDITGRFNATIDFFELVVHCHIIAAALHFFGMKGINDLPTCNALPSHMLKWSTEKQWKVFSNILGKLIDRYVIVNKFADLHPQPDIPRPVMHSLINTLHQNPHAFRISMEHGYTGSLPARHISKTRPLPTWLTALSDHPQPSHEVMQASPDGVFNYACAVLNDGLLLMAFRDAIHEGDGERILGCWKFMLPYFYATGHNKYALEAFQLLAHVHAAASPRLAHQIMWSRTVNTQGQQGHNIPVDLQMEHLNRCLKQNIIGLGANITESTVVHSSRSLKGVIDVCSNFDQVCGVTPDTLHHTRKGSQTDRDMVLVELTAKSRVFDYIPGRQQHSTSYKDLSPHVAQSVNVNALFQWIDQHKKKLGKKMKLRNILKN